MPDISHLRILGCIAWHYVPKKIKNKSATSKLEDRSTRCQFVGYEGSNQYCLWDQRARRIIRSQDVIFDETAMRKMPFKDHGFFHDDIYSEYNDKDNTDDTVQHVDSHLSDYFNTDMPTAPPHQHAQVEDITEDLMDETDDITIANRDQVLLLEDVLHNVNQSLTSLDYSMSLCPLRTRQKSQKLLENEAIDREMAIDSSIELLSAVNAT